MDESDAEKITPDELNADPMTGAHFAHPVGTGLGAAGAGAIGAAIGISAGPVAAVVGAVAGAIAGGLMGKGAAELVNPTIEDSYWRERFHRDGTHLPGHTYDDYAPAYRAGYMHFDPTRTFEETRPELAKHYESDRGDSRLDWENASPAAESAWKRLQQGTDAESAAGGAINRHLFT
jgi:hypothetical protein